MDIQGVFSILKDEANADKALGLLYIGSYFASDKIEINIFSDVLDDAESFINAAKLLKERSFVQYADEPACILINEEVREAVQNHLRQHDKEGKFLKLAFEILDKHFISGRTGILDHAMSVFNAMKGYPELLKRASKFPTVIIEGLSRLERHSMAYTFGREALEVLQRSIGAYHESTCHVQMKLGSVLYHMKRADESLNMLAEAYKKASVASGQNKIDQTLEMIAMITANFTSKPESTVRRLVFGNVSVSETRNNTDLYRWCKYAMVLADLKWNDEALRILHEVLEKRRELLSPDDDDICYVEVCIGQVHIKRGEFPEALVVFRGVYEKRKLRLSENCIRTHITRRGIGLAYQSLGMLDEAVSEFEAAAEGIRQISGDKDFYYLTTRCQAASILFRQQKYERAYDIFCHHYDDFVAVVGEKHKQTLILKYNLGHVLVNLNKPDEALQIWEKLYPECVEVLGLTDPLTVYLKDQLCELIQRQNMLYLMNELNKRNNEGTGFCKHT